MSILEFVGMWLVLVAVTIVLSWIGGYSVWGAYLLIFEFEGPFWGVAGIALGTFGLWVLGHAMHRATQVFNVTPWVAELEEMAQEIPDKKSLFERWK